MYASSTTVCQRHKSHASHPTAVNNRSAQICSIVSGTPYSGSGREPQSTTVADYGQKAFRSNSQTFLNWGSPSLVGYACSVADTLGANHGCLREGEVRGVCGHRMMGGLDGARGNESCPLVTSVSCGMHPVPKQYDLGPLHCSGQQTRFEKLSLVRRLGGRKTLLG
ncbi:hypothetical protein LX32DRAFT_13766 [Colletotrichum zoysiae]|uniref:Uncharacterized protein n=1 Tax=Colletotrichum zoysiae TaxID=1216348 RepID=A0AAD9HEN3_9PEZI|nr:hypothetical protein LX32DRAFT_13766 [Colletotrichum zoysiae]